MKKPFDILLIEDNEPDAEFLRETFSNIPIVNDIIHFDNNKDALQYLEENHPDLGLIISDFCLECELPNTDVLKKADEKNIPYLYLSGMDNTFNSIEAFRQGAIAFLRKPLSVDQFLSVLKGLDRIGLELVTV